MYIKLFDIYQMYSSIQRVLMEMQTFPVSPDMS